MQDTPIISIVVPVYKVEQYLEKCVASIQNQTYPNLEIILVDDGSPDACPQICDRLAAQDERIKVIHQQNGGLSVARNSGIDVATGDYIGFVDSDDFIESQMYEQLYRRAEQSHADIVACGFKKDYPDGNVQLVNYPAGRFEQKEAFELLITQNQAGGCAAWNKLYRRELFKEIRYPAGRIREDVLTTYKLYELINYVEVIEGTYYHYLQREDSIIHVYAGIDDAHKVQTSFERAVDLEQKYQDIALHEYVAVANACMQNCMRIMQVYEKETETYRTNYEIGRNCEQKIEKAYGKFHKTRMKYGFFYHHTKLALPLFSKIYLK